MKTAIRLLIVTFGLASAAFAGVTVSAPTTGTTQASPVHFVAAATSTSPITGMRIYVDNVSVYSTAAAKIDASVAMSAAKHNVVIQAWDSKGTVSKQALTMTVTASAPAPTPTPTPTPAPGLPVPPTTAFTYTDIDQMAGWQSCTTCAGAGGNGPAATMSMVANQASPSMDGKSAKFSISGTTPYSDALWWKQLGAVNTATNLKYDLYFYLTNPTAVQALEFDANQADGKHHFIFGTQCSVGHNQWDVWGNGTGPWQNTGVACAPPAAYTWHHLTWEFKRTATTLTFVGFTYDGVTHYVNKTYPATTATFSELNAAFQMDGNKFMTAYSVWVDKVSLTRW